MIYLDAAATTLEKPPQVRRAVWEAMERMTTPGRGDHAASRLAGETAFRCRCEAAKLFGVQEPERVVFTCNATHGLNIAIRSLIKPGSRVLISGYEHNAVTRVLHAIPGVSVRVIRAPLFDGAQFLRLFRAAAAEGADAAVCCHVSNVFGFALPVDGVAAVCREKGIPLIVDASQSAGTLPVRLDAWNAAFIAMPGHKGLYGPQGTGLLLCGDTAPEPLLFGGTGSASRLQEMPEELPDRLEAGTQNMPGIAGLLEGLRFVKRTTPERILRHEQRLVAGAVERLRTIPGVRLFTGKDPAQQAGVLSFCVKGMDCEEVGEALSRQGIAVRAGLHCAPLAHRTAGTLSTGTVRVSFSAFNDLSQTERLAAALGRIVRENVTF